jgi:hypothetical protein
MEKLGTVRNRKVSTKQIALERVWDEHKKIVKCFKKI